MFTCRRGVTTSNVNALYTNDEIESFIRKFRLPEEYAESHTSPFEQLLRYFFLTDVKFYSKEFYDQIIDLERCTTERKLESVEQYKTKIEYICKHSGVGYSDLDHAKQEISTYQACLTLLKGLSCLLQASNVSEFIEFLNEQQITDDFFNACTNENVEYFNRAKLNQ